MHHQLKIIRFPADKLTRFLAKEQRLFQSRFNYHRGFNEPSDGGLYVIQRRAGTTFLGDSVQRLF
ncbi:hypothetical protein D3C84_517050 [compost metagenome]